MFDEVGAVKFNAILQRTTETEDEEKPRRKTRRWQHLSARSYLV